MYTEYGNSYSMVYDVAIAQQIRGILKRLIQQVIKVVSLFWEVIELW